MIYLCLAVIFLHIIFAPIVIGATVYFDSGLKTAELRVRLFFIPVFSKKLNYDRINEQIRSLSDEKEDKDEKNEKPSERKGIKGYLFRFALGVLKRIVIRKLDLDAEIGLGDAAVSAVAVGFLKTLYSDIRALFYSDGVENIIPNYDEEYIFIDFDGIFSVCIGDIIYAAVCAVKLPRLKIKNDSEKTVYGNAITD